MEPTELDLQYLRDLLILLAEFGVARFSTPEFSLELPVAAPRLAVLPGIVTPAASADAPDDRAVLAPAAQAEPDASGWRHPSLWQASGGIPLSFDGTRK